MADKDETPKRVRRNGQVVKKKGEPAEFVPGPAAQPKFPAPADIIEGLNVWGVNGKDLYLRMPVDGDGRVLKWSSEKLKRALRNRGVREARPDYKANSQMDEVLGEVDNRLVEAAVTVAGFPVGIHTLDDGRRIAVTDSFRLIEPEQRACPLVEKFLGLSLNGDGVLQTDYLFAWLKVAIQALRAGEFRPGHLLALIGPTGSGKSFLQEYLITPLLGGRSADPTAYLAEKTTFNEEIMRAEHQMIQELPTGLGAKERAFFGERLKQLLVNESMPLNAKYQNPLMIRFFRRVTISFNEEKMRAFPALESDFIDKVLLLRFGMGAAGMLPKSDAERAEFRRQIREELPGFVYFLEHWEIPEALLKSDNHGRFGFSSWQHPEIELAMFENEPQSVFLHALDNIPELYRLDDDGRPAHIGPKGGEEWRAILQRSEYWARIERYVDFANGVAIRISQLSKRFPERFFKKESAKNNRWIIKPPEKAPDGIVRAPAPELL